MRLALLSLPLLLTACVAEPPAEDTPDACGASGYQSIIGSPLAAVTLPADLNARIIGPDDVVTMDYRADRLNILTDGQGTITEVRCG